MAITYQCDYCGEEIDNLMVTIDATGQEPGGKYPEKVSGYLGHYHSEPQDGEDRSCYQRVEEAIDLIHSFGPTLETIETISNQQLAYRRRKMNDAEDAA